MKHQAIKEEDGRLTLSLFNISYLLPALNLNQATENGEMRRGISRAALVANFSLSITLSGLASVATMLSRLNCNLSP